jgi:AntA/AntB antirepressor.
MNAEELHTALKIKTPFKEWAEAQIKAGKEFKPFFGKLADGKLGKNYTLSPELEAELVAQQAPKPIKQPVKAKKKKPTQAAPRDETPYTVLAYNEVFLNRTLTDKEARKAGLSLAAIARNREIEPGKVEHPVWKQVNTWPKWMLDRYYAKSLAKKLSALPEAEETAIKTSIRTDDDIEF